MKKTLVVIDMQDEFPAARNEKLIENIARQCVLARKRNWPIIIVEFALHGGTDRKILDAAAEAFLAVKENDNGGDKILEIVKEHNLPVHFRVTGVNACYCVKSTIRTLMENGSVEILKTVPTIGCICEPCTSARWKGQKTVNCQKKLVAHIESLKNQLEQVA